MNDDGKLSVDINTAEVEELTQIPGIGPELAARIIEARPYENLEDLGRVSGISTVFIERISPYVTLQPEAEEAAAEEPVEEVEEPPAAEEPEMEAEEAEPQVVEAEVEEPGEMMISAAEEESPEAAEEEPQVLLEEAAEPAEEAPEMVEEGEPAEEELDIIPVEAPEEAPAKPAAQEPVFGRGETVGILLGGMFITLVLSLVISLGILAGVNSGQLQFASPAQVNELAARAESLRTAIDTNAEDIASLRTRVDNLDALSGRVSEVEQEVEQIGSDMDAVSMQFEELSQQTTELAGQVDTLQEQSDRFSNFLSGLMELMNGLFGSEEGSK